MFLLLVFHSYSINNTQKYKLTLFMLLLLKQAAGTKITFRFLPPVFSFFAYRLRQY